MIEIINFVIIVIILFYSHVIPLKIFFTNFDYNNDIIFQCIYSVGRRYVNEVLLTRAEQYPNMRIHFNHKLVSADLDKGIINFQK